MLKQKDRIRGQLFFVQLQRPATRKLRPSPYDKSTSTRHAHRVFLYLSRCAPVYTSLNGRFHFSTFQGGMSHMLSIGRYLIDTTNGNGLRFQNGQCPSL